jgi:hypothetical protein
MNTLQAVRGRLQLGMACACTGTRDFTQRVVPIGELLTPGFVSRHSRFQNVNQLLYAMGPGPCLLSDLDASNRQRLDDFTRLSTTFPAWEAMLRQARGEWVLRRIGIAVDS